MIEQNNEPHFQRLEPEQHRVGGMAIFHQDKVLNHVFWGFIFFEEREEHNLTVKLAYKKLIFSDQAELSLKNLLNPASFVVYMLLSFIRKKAENSLLLAILDNLYSQP